MLFHRSTGADLGRILACPVTEPIGTGTDTTNRPMAAASDRARYRVYGIRYVLSAPGAGQ